MEANCHSKILVKQGKVKKVISQKTYIYQTHPTKLTLWSFLPKSVADVVWQNRAIFHCVQKSHGFSPLSTLGICTYSHVVANDIRMYFESHHLRKQSLQPCCVSKTTRYKTKKHVLVVWNLMNFHIASSKNNLPSFKTWRLFGNWAANSSNWLRLIPYMNPETNSHFAQRK